MTLSALNLTVGGSRCLRAAIGGGSQIAAVAGVGLCLASDMSVASGKLLE